MVHFSTSIQWKAKLPPGCTKKISAEVKKCWSPRISENLERPHVIHTCQRIIAVMKTISLTLVYSSVPVGVLLHHLETHIGIVVLITNKPDAIDTAFQRRIRFSMSFPMPDAALRSVKTSLATGTFVHAYGWLFAHSSVSPWLECKSFLTRSPMAKPISAGWT